jgi:glycosyltransferase involved in cell wall biosynthesis
MSERIVVAHPARQHSHQLALALHERGALHEYWTGLPLRHDGGMARVLALLQRSAVFPEVPLPEERVRVLPVGAAAHFIERRLGRRGEAVIGQFGDYAVDAAYAHWLKGADGVTAVVAYENAALRTFAAARARGIRTILDAASVHHATADRWRRAAGTGWARDVRARKDAELALADQVLVLSELARDSYVAAGVPAHRISVVPLGYDPGIFHAAEPQPSGRMCFVFVGHASYIKGLDVLLDAAARLGAEGAPFRLIVIGDVEDVGPAGVEFRGKLAQQAIAAELAAADCLVLPSRCDGFGMVVAEALGAGVPAIVSEHAGASDLVRASGAGWIVPADDVAALVERMRRCIAHPEAVLEAKRKARVAAGEWTWQRYRARVADALLGRS